MNARKVHALAIDAIVVGAIVVAIGLVVATVAWAGLGIGAGLCVGGIGLTILLVGLAAFTVTQKEAARLQLLEDIKPDRCK